MDNQLLHGLVPEADQHGAGKHQACHKEGCGKDNPLPEPCLHRPAPAQTAVEKSHGKTLTLIISVSLLRLLKCTALDSNVLLTVSLSKYHSFTVFKCFLGIQNNLLYIALVKSEVLCRATKGHKFTRASINTETNTTKQ